MPVVPRAGRGRTSASATLAAAGHGICGIARAGRGVPGGAAAGGRPHLQPVHLLPFLMRRALNWFVAVVHRHHCRAAGCEPAWRRWRRPGGGEPEARRRSRAHGDVEQRQAFLPGLDAWFSDHFAFRSDAGDAGTASAATSGSAFLLAGSRARAARMAVLRRRWRAGGLHERASVDRGGNPELAEHDRPGEEVVPAHGIAYVFTIFPDKGAIYPELFPQTARRVNRLSRADQIMTAITDTGAAMDVRPGADRREALGAGLPEDRHALEPAGRTSATARSSTRCACNCRRFRRRSPSRISSR